MERTKTIISEDCTTVTKGEHIYEIVKKLPLRYKIWNIGEDNAPDGYVPLCELIVGSEYNINPYTLKAIKVDDEKRHILLRVANYGLHSVKDCERALKKDAKSPYMKKKQEYAKLAIPVLREIC